MGESRPRILSDGEKLDWLRLIRSQAVGPITFHRLLERFGPAAAALDALPGLARRGGRRDLKVCSRDAAEREMEQVSRAGARLVALGEPDYPPLLALIEDAPPLISVLGHAGLLRKRAVAVVGARNASLNGLTIARRIAGELGGSGLMVVSGMARGIDAAAHQGALDTGTVAVLGGGVDVPYPRENAALYDDLKARGTLVSEVAPGVQPQARHFPRRNRIIAGMGRGVLVVEASPRSGSLITARLALEQGREVFAVPGSPLDPRARGANDLLRQGATLAETGEDIVRALRDMAPKPLEEPEPVDFAGGTPASPDQDAVDAARGRVTELLGPSPVTVDEVLRNCQFSLAVVTLVLLEMELAGRLQRHPGNRVSLVPD
ncbi:MAG: DNA-protecting protein DprA [Hyphomicrobiales bacterium]|nr:DNA-protecting protein DprA [Hyphomicrobiales bacterium]MCP5370771.1 DNA-protecting protein DprA [Hyphomicrobiales bacterium]